MLSSKRTIVSVMLKQTTQKDNAVICDLARKMALFAPK
jgi:hypothetical protein